MQFVCGVRLRPGLFLHARDRFGIELADVRRTLGIEPAPADHRLRAPFLERRIVEIGIRPRGQDLERERRRFDQVASDNFQFAALKRAQQPLEAFDVHRLVQAIVDCLPD